MSDKNPDARSSARERLRVERERDKVRARRRRAAVVGGAIAAGLAVAGVVGVLVADGGMSGAGSSAAAPPGAIGAQDLAVPAGSPDAPATLTVYEDFRCPACDAFEKNYRATIHQLMDSGQLRGEYHLVRIIDGNLGGTGSLEAGNAAACAQAAGRFRAYHDVLYDNQPEERQDLFADKKTLLKLADKVPGLSTPAFTSCVEHGTYDTWVTKSNSQFDTAGYGATPTVLLNGRNIYKDQTDPLTPDKLRHLVAQIAAKAGRRGTSGSPSPASGSPSSASGPPSRAAGSPSPAAGRGGISGSAASPGSAAPGTR